MKKLGALRQHRICGRQIQRKRALSPRRTQGSRFEHVQTLSEIGEVSVSWAGIGLVMTRSLTAENEMIRHRVNPGSLDPDNLMAVVGDA